MLWNLNLVFITFCYSSSIPTSYRSKTHYYLGQYCRFKYRFRVSRLTSQNLFLSNNSEGKLPVVRFDVVQISTLAITPGQLYRRVGLSENTD